MSRPGRDTVLAGARTLRAGVREAGHIDRGALDFLSGARVAAGVVLVLVVGLALGHLDAAVSMAGGALLTGNSALAGGARPQLPLMASTTAVMAVATFVGSVSGQVSWLHLVLLAPWCAFAGLLVAVGAAPATIGVQAVIAFVVYGRFAQPAPVALELAGLVVVGGVVQVVLAALSDWPLSLRVERRALAASFDALAQLAAGPPGASSGPAGAVLDLSEAALAQPALFGHADAEALLSLQAVGRRLRLELTVLGAHIDELDRSGRPTAAVMAIVTEVRAAAAEVLRGLSGALGAGGSVDLTRFQAAAGAVAALGPSPVTGGAHVVAAVVDGTEALAGQLRAAARLVAAALVPRHGRGPRLAEHSPGLRRRQAGAALEVLRANLTLEGAAARHALRLAAVVVLAELIALHTPLQRGYWVALTAVVVLKPDFAATFSRGVARLIGTCVGVGLAGLIVVATHGERGAMVAVLAVLVAVAAGSFRASYTVFTMFLTGIVVLLVSFVTGDALGTAGDRLIDTVIGGVLALAAYAAWPTWSDTDAAQAVVTLIGAQRAYLRLVIEAVTGLGPFDESCLSRAASRTRLARSNAEAAVGRSLAEPAHRLGAAPGVLATIHRVGVGAHSLRADIARLERAPVVGAQQIGPAARALAAGLDQAMDAIGVALAEPDALRAPPGEPGRMIPARHGRLPALRRLHTRLAACVHDATPGDAAQRERHDALVAETDAIVDAVNTLGRMAGLAGPDS